MPLPFSYVSSRTTSMMQNSLSPLSKGRRRPKVILILSTKEFLVRYAKHELLQNDLYLLSFSEPASINFQKFWTVQNETVKLLSTVFLKDTRVLLSLKEQSYPQMQNAVTSMGLTVERSVSQAIQWEKENICVCRATYNVVRLLS